MEWLVEKIGVVLLTVSAALLVIVVVRGLQRLTERRERWRAKRLLRTTLAAVMGVLMAEGLPLLWPALTEWKPAVFGACLGLAFAATREWGVPRFPPVASEEQP